MLRREFLKRSAATATAVGAVGAAGLAGASCGGLLPDGLLEPGQPPLPDMDQYLAQVDAGLAFITHGEPDADTVFREDRAAPAEADLARQALRSLYLTGMLADLPDAGQVHPGMQARIDAHLPEMDAAVYGTIDYLNTISDERAAAVQRYLNRPDNPGIEIAEQIGRYALRNGVSTSRRLQTRAMITGALARLKRQPPRRLFAEYIGKVERQAAIADDRAAAQRYLIAQQGERAFWEREERLARYAARWQQEGATAGGPRPDAPPTDRFVGDAGVADEPAAAPAASPAPSPVEVEREQLLRDLAAARAASTADDQDPSDREDLLSKGQRRLHRGGWVLGIGGATVAVSAFMAGTAAAPGAIGLGTVAAVLLIVGLIMVAVGTRNEREALGEAGVQP